VLSSRGIGAVRPLDATLFRIVQCGGPSPSDIQGLGFNPPKQRLEMQLCLFLSLRSHLLVLCTVRVR